MTVQVQAEAMLLLNPQLQVIVSFVVRLTTIPVVQACVYIPFTIIFHKTVYVFVVPMKLNHQVIVFQLLAIVHDSLIARVHAPVYVIAPLRVTFQDTVIFFVIVSVPVYPVPFVKSSVLHTLLLVSTTQLQDWLEKKAS